MISNMSFPKLRCVGLTATCLLTWGSLTASAGQLYVSDRDASYVHKYITSGAGKIFANIYDCSGLAFDAAGILYVASFNSSAIYKLRAHGSYTLFASVEEPMFLVCDSLGNLFVSHYGSTPGIAKIANDGSITPFASGLFNALTFDSAGYLYATDAKGGVKKFAPSGKKSVFSNDLSFPWGLAFDSTSGYLFVSSGTSIYKYDRFGNQSLAYDDLLNPQALAFDKDGNLFVADDYGFILKITPDGNRSTFATVTAWDLAFRP
jgi:hypothetical protein